MSSPTWPCPRRATAAATTPSQNVAVVRRLHELFVDGRIEEAASLLDPDIDWLEPEEQPDRHVVKGAEAARAALNGWLETGRGHGSERGAGLGAPGGRGFPGGGARAPGPASAGP